jgi:tRNA pseudouridine55 synthase
VRNATHRSESIDGILLLDKPAGMTSNQALQKVKRLLGAKKAGHTGSLDPGATGMLPLCFGEATKVCAYLLEADKTYRVTAKLGSATDTGDADGKVTDTAPVPELDRPQWQAVLDGFVGESMQVPPMYSALKRDGKRLYELARKGEHVEREPRPIRIDEIDLLEAAPNRLVFRVRCSKGTYVRSLVEDIARKAGTLAYTQRLHRESVSGFEEAPLENLASLEEKVAADRPAMIGTLLPADRALVHLPSVRVGHAEAERFRAGNAVEADTGGEATSGLARVYERGGDEEFLGVGEVLDTGQVTPRRVFAQR